MQGLRHICLPVAHHKGEAQINVKDKVDLTYVIQEMSSSLQQLCYNNCSHHLTSSHYWLGIILGSH